MEISLQDLSKEFTSKKLPLGLYSIKYKRANRPIILKLPFKIDIKIARLYGMIYDGSLDKNLKGIRFCQKKDPNKAYEFQRIIKGKFSIVPRVINSKGKFIISLSNKTLCHFLYYYLDFYKCDEPSKVPLWIKNGKNELVKEYLRYAFAMEGSITDPVGRNKDIKFHSCSKNLVSELQVLLREKFSINSKILTYYIKDYGEKYYLYFNSNDNTKKFAKIGFALPSHQKRLEGHLLKIKPLAKDLTLLIIYKNNLLNFSNKDLRKILRCHKRTVHYRLVSLVKERCLILNSNRTYELTAKGLVRAIELYGNINEIRLRTSSKENEAKVLSYLEENKIGWRNRIAESLNINCLTVRDVLRRLLNKNLIELAEIDKFQRKIYRMKGSSGSSPVLA